MKGYCESEESYFLILMFILRLTWEYLCSHFHDVLNTSSPKTMWVRLLFCPLLNFPSTRGTYTRFGDKKYAIQSWLKILHRFISRVYMRDKHSEWEIRKERSFIKHLYTSVHFIQSRPTLCNLMDCSMPGLPVYHQLPEFTQTHVHWVGNAIQTSHPLLSPSPPTFNLFQHQSLFKWVNSSHQVAKVSEFQLQLQSFQWTPRTDLL